MAGKEKGPDYLARCLESRTKHDQGCYTGLCYWMRSVCTHFPLTAFIRRMGLLLETRISWVKNVSARFG